jgi:uncharacterized membrane protein YkvA (DUF1232 family)
MSKRSWRLLLAAQSKRLRLHLVALWTLYRHPQTPRAVKWLTVAVLAYALSPIDLIPDFIPVLGLLDDLVLLPLGVALIVRLTPRPLWLACLQQAEQRNERLPRMLWGAVGVLLVWALLLGLFVWWLLRAVGQAA